MEQTAFDMKCKTCNAPLKFNPKTQRWDCEYCGSSFTEADFTESTSKESNTDTANNLNKDNIDNTNLNQSVQEDTFETNVELDEYSCPTCGAIVVTDKNTTATECVYCGSTAIMKNRLEGKFKPKKLIPFKTRKEDAINAFEKFVKERWFSPDEFESKSNIEKVSGVYIPFWLFDCQTNGDITIKGKTFERWADYNYRYTRVNTFACRRAGTMNFTDIPADGSSKFPDDIMDSIEPYDYKEFKPFNYSYLSGFLAEKYDLDYNQVLERAKTRAQNTTVEKLSSDVKGLADAVMDKRIVEVNNGEVEYALLPVWMLNIKYNDKMYTFAMNGQTGKMIGNIPIKKKKVVLYSLKLFSIIFIIGCIIALLFGGK